MWSYSADKLQPKLSCAAMLTVVLQSVICKPVGWVHNTYIINKDLLTCSWGEIVH